MKNISVENLPIDEVKNKIFASLNKKIEITQFSKQGKLLHKFIGVIVNAYDNLFVIKIELNGYQFNKSFTYIDFSIGDFKFEIID